MSTSQQDIIVKSASDIQSDILRTIKNGLIENGVTNPNVSPSSDFGIVSAALSNEIAIAENNVVVAGNALMGDTAIGSDLDRILAYYGLARRPASSAIGSLIVSASGSSLVPNGAQLLSPNGLRYRVLLGGIYGNGASIKIQALDTGSQTDLTGGTVLTWVSTPAFFAPQASVSITDPVTGGVDAEDDETARARLLARLASPPGAGNPSQLIGFAEDSDPSVQTAFVSAAARGPGTVDITVVGYATATSKNRNIDSTLFANVVSPNILGQIPQAMDGYAFNVTNYPIDIAITLSLPNPTTANPAGPGGGFLDPSPLQGTIARPALRVIDGYGASGNNVLVPSNTATSFWVELPIAPISGTVYNISYLSPVTWTLYQGTTNGVYKTTGSFTGGTDVANLYLLTVNSPFYQNATTGQIIQPGNWIFPTALNTATYVSAFLTYMAGLGPGERTTNPGLLPRAYRVPRETASWPYKLDNRLLKPIINSGDEVYDGALLFRGSGGSTFGSGFIDYGSLTTNSDPAFALYAPQTAYLANGTALGPSFIFTPSNFGIYKQQ
jgi:uncharacterized phage protein gp47/JayE